MFVSCALDVGFAVLIMGIVVSIDTIFKRFIGFQRVVNFAFRGKFTLTWFHLQLI